MNPVEKNRARCGLDPNSGIEGWRARKGERLVAEARMLDWRADEGWASTEWVTSEEENDWRCLCRGLLEQTTYTRFLRLTIMQCSHIFFKADLTFIVCRSLVFFR